MVRNNRKKVTLHVRTKLFYGLDYCQVIFFGHRKIHLIWSQNAAIIHIRFSPSPSCVRIAPIEYAIASVCTLNGLLKFCLTLAGAFLRAFFSQSNDSCFSGLQSQNLLLDSNLKNGNFSSDYFSMIHAYQFMTPKRDLILFRRRGGGIFKISATFSGMTTVHTRTSQLGKMYFFFNFSLNPFYCWLHFFNRLARFFLETIGPIDLKFVQHTPRMCSFGRYYNQQLALLFKKVINSLSCKIKLKKKQLSVIFFFFL